MPANYGKPVFMGRAGLRFVGFVLRKGDENIGRIFAAHVYPCTVKENDIIILYRLNFSD